MNNGNRRLGFIPIGKPKREEKVVRREKAVPPSPYVPNPMSPSRKEQIIRKVTVPQPVAVPTPREKTPV